MATETSTPPRPKKAPGLGRFKIGFNVLLQFAIMLLILLMVNYLSFNHYRRWDYTRSHFYSLSEKSKNVLGGLKKKVKAYVFFPAASEITMDVVNLLKEYQYASNGKMEVEYIDPYRDLARAQQLQNAYKFASDKNIVILDCDGRKQFVSDQSMKVMDSSGTDFGQPRVTGFNGEQAITGALLQITDEKPNVLYAVTGHGERDLASDDFGAAKVYIEHEDVKVLPLSLENVNAIPPDAGLVFILGARYDFTDREIKILNEYWEKKGRLFVLLDPDALKQTPNLAGFLASQGIKPNDDRILRVEMSQVSAIAKLLLDVIGFYVEGSPVTKNIKNVDGLFPGGSQSLALDPGVAQNAGTRLQPLAQARQGYWGETDYNIKDGDAPPVFLPTKDHGQPLWVAASAEKGAISNVQVDSSRMIVVGNCYFLATRSLTMANANVDFTVNSVDWLLDRVELIGIAPKTYTAFSLTLTNDQMSHILFTTMFVIPGIMGILSIGFWWKRRR